MATRTGKKVLDAALGLIHPRPPLWLMRQAGRYLPEYREVRARAGSFIDLCFSPELASEVTLQPIRRFDFDAAIIFSDILVVPHALGQKLRFTDGEGPRLQKIAFRSLDGKDAALRLAPISETVKRTRTALAGDKTLIGFCGGPWTVATYMIAGEGSSDQAEAKLFALTHPDEFAALIDLLVETSAGYLAAQLSAGADLVQIFESWSANLDEASFRDWVIEPTKKMVALLRQKVPGATVIGFPRGAGAMLPAYARETGVDCIGLDQMTPLAFARDHVALPVQGNLDPLRLRAGGAALSDRVDVILEAFAGRPHVFNLGHGILPDTPLGHVQQLVQRVRG